MRNLILFGWFVLALPRFAFAQQPAMADKSTQSTPSKNGTAQPKLADLLEAKVRAAWAAFKKKDKDGYAEFLTDDFQAVEADGDGERPTPHIMSGGENRLYHDY